MSTTDKISYAASTAIACTMASLASSATAGRSCAAVDNTANLYDDALLTVSVTTSASAPASDLACYVYLFGSEDGTTFGASSAEGVGADAAMTFDSPTNMRGPYALACPAASVTYRLVIPVAAAFGGLLPRKWGYAIRNYTGQPLGAGAASYTGITYTNA